MEILAQFQRLDWAWPSDLLLENVESLPAQYVTGSMSLEKNLEGVIKWVRSIADFGRCQKKRSSGCTMKSLEIVSWMDLALQRRESKKKMNPIRLSGILYGIPEFKYD